MTAWLAEILGVVVVGVILELLTHKGRMGKFVRSIYAFVVLLVIINPLPRLLQSWRGQWDAQNQIIDQKMVEKIQQAQQQTQIQQLLSQLGYAQALVTVQDQIIYVNLGCEVTAEEQECIKQKIGGEVYLI